MQPNQKFTENNTSSQVANDSPEAAIKTVVSPATPQLAVQHGESAGLPSTQPAPISPNQVPVESQPEQLTGVVTVSDMQVEPMPGSPPKNSSRFKFASIALVACIVLLVGAGMTFFFIVNASKQSESSKHNNSRTDSSTANPSKERETEDNNQLPAQNVQSPLDEERKSDINAIHTQLEAYYSQNGSYPPLSDITDANFRNTNLKGLTEAILTDPAGSELISSSATAIHYGYAAPKTASCPSGRVSVCNVYVVTAILSDGQTYTKQSLN